MLDDDRNLARLAAARAATSPSRRQVGSDILISTLVELCCSKESFTSDDATRLLNELWRTHVVSTPVVEEALAVGEKLHLFVRIQFEDRLAWAVTSHGRRQAEIDRKWVRQRWRQFEAAVRDRLEETCDTPIREDRFESLASHLFEALAEGAESVRHLPDFTSFEELRPVVYEFEKITNYLRREIEPRAVMRAMLDLALAALDPDVDFADDIVDLVVMGSILHGVVTRRDVPHRAFAGTRVVLDTSVLLDLLCPDSADALLEKVLEECRAAGVEAIVPEHVLEEWERLWHDAELQFEHLTSEQEQILRAGGSQLTRNAVVREYLRADPEISWSRFQLGKRNPRHALEARGVTIREHGNRSSKDREVVEGIWNNLLELSDDKGRSRGGRRPSWRASMQSLAA